MVSSDVFGRIKMYGGSVMLFKRGIIRILLLGLLSSMLLGCGNQNATTEQETTQEETVIQMEEDAMQEGNTTSEANATQGEENSIAENTQDQEGEMEDKDSIRLRDALQESMGAMAGTAVTVSEIEDERVWDIITTHFSTVTIGNELKPDCLFSYSNGNCPGTEEVTFNGSTMTVPVLNYSRAEIILDKIKEWNDENPDSQIKVRGHVLVWHSQTPEWFFHENYDKTMPYVDKDTMNQRLEWYIATVLTHFTGENSPYKNMFYGWDVVNEAVSDGTGTYRTDTENSGEELSQDTHGSNSSWWHVYESNEYILNAFIYANKYAPESLELYYNDYNECVGLKLSGIIELLKAVKELEGEPGVGTRIDAFGMQGHYDMSSPAMDKIDAALRAYARVVGKVQITELDLKASEEYNGSDEAKATEYEKQATRYKIIYRILKSANEEEGISVTGITFWGTVDHYSWLQSRSDVGGGADGNLPQCPLLFDENYEKKPAFWAFIEQ